MRKTKLSRADRDRRAAKRERRREQQLEEAVVCDRCLCVQPFSHGEDAPSPCMLCGHDTGTFATELVA